MELLLFLLLFLIITTHLLPPPQLKKISIFSNATAVQIQLVPTVLGLLQLSVILVIQDTRFNQLVRHALALMQPALLHSKEIAIPNVRVVLTPIRKDCVNIVQVTARHVLRSHYALVVTTERGPTLAIPAKFRSVPTYNITALPMRNARHAQVYYHK